jgi:hypothetical protein
MPLTVFDCQGIAAARRQRIEAAVEAAAGQRRTQPYEAWIAADPFRATRGPSQASCVLKEGYWDA